MCDWNAGKPSKNAGTPEHLLSPGFLDLLAPFEFGCGSFAPG
jgi:hypothetical protein